MSEREEYAMKFADRETDPLDGVEAHHRAYLAGLEEYDRQQRIVAAGDFDGSWDLE